MKINAAKIKRILVIRNDRFGEFLLNIPALRALKHTFLNARVTLVVDPCVKELIQDSPFVDEIIVDNFSKKLRFFGALQLAAQLKKQRFNIAIMLNPSKIFNIISFLAMIPIRVGYDKKCAFLLTRKIEDKKYEGIKHEVEYNLDLVKLVGAKAGVLDITLPIRGDDLIFINNLLAQRSVPADKFIAVHPWTSDIKKQWPLKNFIRLINLLTEEPNVKVIMIGGKENKNSISEEHFNNKEAVIDLTGELSLRQSSGLFTKCVCLVSSDSGPIHLAAASNLLTIALFRNTPLSIGPKRWGPWGKNHIIIAKDELSDITPEEVAGKIREVL